MLGVRFYHISGVRVGIFRVLVLGCIFFDYLFFFFLISLLVLLFSLCSVVLFFLGFPVR